MSSYDILMASRGMFCEHPYLVSHGGVGYGINLKAVTLPHTFGEQHDNCNRTDISADGRTKPSRGVFRQSVGGCWLLELQRCTAIPRHGAIQLLGSDCEPDG